MISKFLPNSSFARNVITLMTGTSIAQAIPIAISPILTRLYTPDDFGVLALYVALTSIISVVVTGRYELAIMLPKKDSEAINIVAFSIVLSILISCVFLFIILLFDRRIADLLGAPEISYWLYFIPLSTMLTGVYQSLNYWSNRRKSFRRMVVSRVLQSSSVSGVQLGAAYTSFASAGLIGGQIVGLGVSTALLARILLRDDHQDVIRVKATVSLALAKRYRNFPKYLVAAHGFNTGSFQSPVILLGALFNPGVAGFYTLTQRVVGSPMSIVAGAIGDVFRQEASHSYSHTGACKAIYLKALKRLVGVSTVPFIFFSFVAPELFQFVFGPAWRISGEYAQILAPLFWLRFITSPLSNMFVIAQKQRLDLFWQISLFLLVVSSFLVGYYYKNISLALILFCASYCLMYVINGIISYRLSCGQPKYANSVLYLDKKMLGG